MKQIRSNSNHQYQQTHLGIDCNNCFEVVVNSESNFELDNVELFNVFDIRTNQRKGFIKETVHSWLGQSSQCRAFIGKFKNHVPSNFIQTSVWGRFLFSQWLLYYFQDDMFGNLYVKNINMSNFRHIYLLSSSYQNLSCLINMVTSISIWFQEYNVLPKEHWRMEYCAIVNTTIFLSVTCTLIICQDSLSDLRQKLLWSLSSRS